MSGVQPIVARTSSYGLVCGGIGAALERLALGVTELDRLQEARRHRQAAPPRRGEVELRRARHRRGIERGIAARLGYLRGLRPQSARRVHEQAQHHVALDLLVEQRGRVLNFFFSSRRRHTRLQGDWSSDVCSSDLSLPTASRYFLGTIWPP